MSEITLEKLKILTISIVIKLPTTIWFFHIFDSELVKAVASCVDIWHCDSNVSKSSRVTISIVVRCTVPPITVNSKYYICGMSFISNE